MERAARPLLARGKKWDLSQQELAALRRRGKSNLAARKREGGGSPRFRHRDTPTGRR